jgi:hypothetical protein
MDIREWWEGKRAFEKLVGSWLQLLLHTLHASRIGWGVAACKLIPVAGESAPMGVERSRRKAPRKNNLSNFGAGILAAGKALVRRISAAICNERATPPAAKRTSQNAQVIFAQCRKGKFRR